MHFILMMKKNYDYHKAKQENLRNEKAKSAKTAMNKKKKRLVRRQKVVVIIMYSREWPLQDKAL